MTLPWARLLLHSICKRSFHTSKCTSLFHEFPDKDGFLKKSEEQKSWEKWSLKKRLLLEFELLKHGIKESSSEFVDGVMTGPRLFVSEKEVDVVWRFKGDKEELKEWVITTDKDNDIGFSTAQ